jgi:porphobilinogen synthase
MNRFPTHRGRRLRRTDPLRRMVRESNVSSSSFIYPMFVHPLPERVEIASMPGVYRWPVRAVAREAEAAARLGIPAILLFGIPRDKNELGSENFAADGVVQRAIRAIKDSVPQMTVITDVCMCEYTSHGHCGILRGNTVDNDRTLEVLGRVAASHAAAGADIVAPSGMMDGMVAALRSALDAQQFTDTSILSYSAKYASAFYGPFRDAAGSAPQLGDRRSYQMDPANAREALREVALDIDEGADIVMIKPALPYLDVIRQVRDRFDHPVAAYNVSGEYAMVKAGAQRGWIDEKRIVLELLTSMRRAGADLILTYHAVEAARWLEESEVIPLEEAVHVR